MRRDAAATPSRAGEPVPANTADLDPIVLRQALIDVEMANQRVIDLTARLTKLNRQYIQASTELHALRFRAEQAERDLAALRSSTTGQAIRVVAAVKRKLRP